MDITKQNKIDQIMSDFALYLNPDLLKDEYSTIIVNTKFKKEKMEEYLQLMADIHYAWQKTLRYETYFTEFYPDSKSIEKFEALNHHIHAYLQDMTILKNKIEVFLNTIKNGIKKSADSKKNVDEFFKKGIEKTKNVFADISKNRDPHHHRGMRFFDSDLLKAENAHRASEIFQIDSYVNPKRKPEIIHKLVEKEKEGFDIAKVRWIEIAKKNAKQTSEYLDELMEIIYSPLYDFLEITDPIELLKIDSKNT